jgi:hypothetical protein
MNLALGILVGVAVGLLLLAAIRRRLGLLLWVFCHEALMYFGLLPYPHEVARRPRVRPPGSAALADRNLPPEGD